MLDIEIYAEPTDVATDVLSVADMKKHLRISPTVTALDDVIEAAIEDALDKLEGSGGELNRTIRRLTWRRYMKNFPGNDADGNPLPILLPYPPLISVDAITIEDGSSPDNNVSTDDYVVKSGMLVPEIHPVDVWPTIEDAPRAVSVTYTAGYTTYPPKLIRMLKFLGAHYVENTEATVLEQNKTLISRDVLYAMNDLRAALKVPLSFDNWNED